MQFNKRSDDKISLYELDEYMKRNKINHHVSKEERRLIFDFVDGNHKGEVSIRDLLQKTEQQEFKDNNHAESMFKIRDFLKNHLEKLRAEKEAYAKAHRDPDLEHRKKAKAVAGEKHLIKQAIGQKTFDLDVDHDELHEAIEHFYTKAPTDVQEKKFARFLRHSNLNLSIVPFYDMRHEELDLLKGRAARIDRQFGDPATIGRLDELSKTRWKSSLATTNETDPETMAMKQTAIVEGRMNLSRSLPNLHVRPSPLAVSTSDDDHLGSNGTSAGPSSVPVSRSLAPSASVPSINSSYTNYSSRGGEALSPIVVRTGRSQQSLQSTTSSPISHGAYSSTAGSRIIDPHFQEVGPLSSSKRRQQPRNLAEINPGDEISSSVSTDYIGSSAADEKNPKRYTTALKLKEDLFYERGQAKDSDFYTQIVDESASMGKMKDPSKVMRIEKIDAHAYLPSGKRAMHAGPTDWTRVGVGGTRDAADIGYGHSVNDEDPFMTTNSKYYPPLIYRSSQPVARDLVSEAEINFRKKEFQRAERYARTKANMEVTKTRLEYEQVEKEVRSLRRDHGRVEDRIRYQTAMFLNDLKAYKSQPLVRMAKKQNINLADRMWNGNVEHNVPENRDFQSTYNASFDSSILRMSDTLIAPPSENVPS